MVRFKNKYSLQTRKEEAMNVINKYSDRIPVICELSEKASTDCPVIDKNKYLVPKDLTLGQFMYVIRKRLNIPSEKAIFLLADGIIPSSSALISDIYSQSKDDDGFLYITYSFENTFG